MFHKVIFGLFIASLCCCHTLALGGNIFSVSKLANVVLTSTYALEDNPSLTADCFSLYMPKIAATTTQYENAYDGCLNATAEAQEKLKQEVQSDIDSIQTVADGICINFKRCANNTNLYTLFDCYYQAVSEIRCN